jgi:hypothetical protein
MPEFSKFNEKPAGDRVSPRLKTVAYRLVVKLRMRTANAQTPV